jgi:hypothetical protein
LNIFHWYLLSSENMDGWTLLLYMPSLCLKNASKSGNYLQVRCNTLPHLPLNVKFKVFTALHAKIAVIWVVTLHSHKEIPAFWRHNVPLKYLSPPIGCQTATTQKTTIWTLPRWYIILTVSCTYLTYKQEIFTFIFIQNRVSWPQ